MSREKLITEQLQGISTRDFLGILDHDQLLRAIEIAQELMAKKDAEKRVPVWVLSTDYGNVAAFASDEYQRAVDRARILVDEEAKDGHGFVIELESQLKRESEVPALFALDANHGLSPAARITV